ncbi:phospholipase D-like domain-containing protein [Acidobacteria bacterium AH-259-D05]|nr:phospholipase D-like domain-containing protein [Acidobacteria bacterium AH-259-D05]
MINQTGKLLDYWLPQEGSGRAIACLAVSYTFDPDFFEGDCLARFLGLDSRRDEGDDLAFLIDQEERLAETRVSVLVDRSYNPEGRSLRWDILPVAVRGGVQHAKVAILIWDRLIRCLIGSANLTEAGYRNQVEGAVALDACEGSQVPAAVFLDLIQAVRELAIRAPGQSDQAGPKERALSTLQLAEERVAALDLPLKLPGRLKLSVVTSAPGRPALPQLDDVWQGGPARSATVLSPFFDSGEGESEAAKALVERLAQRGHASATFVVPVDTMNSQTIVRAPQTIAQSVPQRVKVEFRPFLQPDENEVRRLHAKALVLESKYWTALLIGSSNFTSAGLGTLRSRGNLEINLAFGAPSGSGEARNFGKLIPMGDPIDLSDVAWNPKEDDEDSPRVVLPTGFIECLLDPSDEPCLILHLDPPDLPAGWSILNPVDGTEVIGSDEWNTLKKPAVKQIAPSALPFFLEVHWNDGDQEQTAGWAVNVTEPAKLPPPEELRDLPVRALLQALASTRPLHEALSAALQRDKKDGSRLREAELDPLKRYSRAGELLHRARRVSAALEGLKRRLERPTTNLDALVWRLKGPFGPKAIAKGLIEETKSGRAVPGETNFLLAELALTLARVDWREMARFLSYNLVIEMVREVLDELNHLQLEHEDSTHPHLMAYVKDAFKEAQL